MDSKINATIRSYRAKEPRTRLVLKWHTL